MSTTFATPARLRCVAAISLALCPLAAQVPALGGRDPVQLCNGQDTAGKAEFTRSHLGYDYRFASAASLATFQQDPDRYGIQFGGACARMGPLSGLGDPQRYHVHRERIYLFASEGCRTGFQKRADDFLELTTPAPTPDAAAKASASAWIARAVHGHGGRERLQALRSYQHECAKPSGDGSVRTQLRAQWPLRVRFDDDYTYGEKISRYARVVGPADSFFDDNGKVRSMATDVRLEVQRDLGHEPLLALRELVDGNAVTAPAGKREVLGATVDELAVWQHGRITFLGLDADGRIVTARFRGRGAGLFFGAVELRFEAPQVFAGILVPTRVRGTFDGKESTRFDEQRIGIAVDPPLDAAPFTRPK